MEQKEQKILKGVKGNPLSLAIPLQKVTFTPEGKVREDYIPAEGSVVEVVLENSSSRFTFNPVVEGNIVHFADKGTLPVGEYNVVILVTEPDGTQRRSKWCNIVQVHDRTEAVLDAFDDFPDFGEVEVLDATVFIFAKGDKGDKGDPGEKGDKGDPGEKGDKGDAGTTDYNLLENKPTRVSQFDNDALYATESFVNSSIATATATYRGSYNLVTDLGLSVGASAADVSAALATSIPDADNNDYCFVQVPVATDTPTVIARIDRYKHNGSGWLYEYTLNNSGFTAEQWDAINSGITSGDVDKLDALPTSAQLTSLLNGKQDTINDLGTIRSGASAGATAYQKPQAGIPESDLSQGVKDKMNEKEVFVAIRGTTTYDEIVDAATAGKNVICKDTNGSIFYLIKVPSNGNNAVFTAIMQGEARLVQCTPSNNWSGWNTMLEVQSNKKSTITGNESSTTFYPTTKAVADYVAEKDKLVEVEYGVTTVAEIDAILANGKIPYINIINGGINYTALLNAITSVRFVFSSVNREQAFSVELTKASDTWSTYGVISLERAANRKSTITGFEASNDVYPSTKAVADYVHQEMAKWGVVSQTLNVIIVRDPVVQTSNLGYNIEATDPVEGWIPQANIDLFENAGAVFNSSTGYFELNGITNIAYDEMQRIYTTGDIWRYYTIGDMNIASEYDIGIYRTVFPTSCFKTITSSFLRSVFNLEVIKFSRTPFINTNNGAISYAFYNNVNALKKVLDRIDCQANTAFNLDNCFTGCPLLETIYINRLQKNIGFKLNYKLNYETVSYMVSHATNTSAITITVHPTIYGYLTGTIQPPEETGGTSAEWQQIVTDATAKNISFASA